VQQQIGASVGPITPHPGMTVGLWVEGNRLRALFDGAVVRDVVDTTTPILTGRFLGLEGLTDTGNRVRVASLSAVGVVADATLTTVRAQTTVRAPVTVRPLVTVRAPTP